MFDNDYQIRGVHATYWKALSKVPGNAVETSRNFKVFDTYISVFMVAPIIGLLRGKKGTIDPNDTSKDTAGMLAAIQNKNQAKLKYIYRLIILLDDTSELSQEDRIDMAFRDDNDPEITKKGFSTFEAYFLGGLEILYEEFVLKCTTDEDYIDRIYSFVDEFREEQNVAALGADIDTLLKR